MICQTNEEPNTKKMAIEGVKIKNVLFMIAMEQEAQPLLNKLSLVKIENIILNSPCVVYSGVYKDHITVSVVTNGKCPKNHVDNVGTTPAALSTFLAINQLKPDIVINAGTAGGFKRKGGAIGDSYLSTVVKYHDRRIPIPGFTECGIGNYESYPCPNLIKELNLKSGIVTTSNSLDHCEMDDKIMLENDASIKEMEAASIAWTANLSHTPFIALKVITDIVDGDQPSHEEFLLNLSTAAHSLQETIPKVLDYIIDKRLDDL